MITTGIFIKGFLSIIITLTLLFAIGGLVRRIVSSDSFVASAYNIFLNFVIGTISLVFFYSVIITRGVTFSWLFLIIGLLYFFHKNKIKNRIKNKNETSIKSKNIAKYIGILLLWSAVIYIILFIYNCNIDGSYFRPIEVDNYHYAILSKYLNMGYECSNIQAIVTGNFNLTPYHYGEIWLNAFVYKLGGLNPLFTYSVIIQCIVLVIILFGFLTILEKKFSKIPIYIITGLILLLFITDMSYLYKIFISSEFLYTENRGYLFIMTKISFLAIFFLTSIVLLIEKKYCELFYSQLLIFPIFFLASPAIGGLVAGTFIMDYVQNKKLRWDYIISFAVFIIAFFIYTIIGLSGLQNYSEGSHNFLSSIPWYKLRMLVTTPILYIALYFHLFLLIRLLCNAKIIIKHIQKYLIPIICFFLCTIISSVIGRGFNHIAVQIVGGIYPTILAILLPSLILYYWDNIKGYKNIRKYSIYAVFVLFLATGAYSINYVMSRKLYPIKESRQAYEKEVVLHINPEKSLTIGVFSNYPNFDFNNNVVVNYGTFQTYLDAYFDDITYLQLNIQKEYFIHYETLYSVGLSKSEMKEDEYRLQYIDKNDINYIIIRPDASLPDNLANYYELVAQDETGESFYKRTNK